MKINKELWLLEFGNLFWIQFNWEDFGWRLGLEYDSNGYSRSIQIVLFKPSLCFGYINKQTRLDIKEK